jgi:hypothetical protein
VFFFRLSSISFSVSFSVSPLLFQSKVRFIDHHGIDSFVVFILLQLNLRRRFLTLLLFFSYSCSCVLPLSFFFLVSLVSSVVSYHSQTRMCLSSPTLSCPASTASTSSATASRNNTHVYNNNIESMF